MVSSMQSIGICCGYDFWAASYLCFFCCMCPLFNGNINFKVLIYEWTIILFQRPRLQLQSCPVIVVSPPRPVSPPPALSTIFLQVLIPLFHHIFCIIPMSPKSGHNLSWLHTFFLLRLLLLSPHRWEGFAMLENWTYTTEKTGQLGL
jgi:hypothetical protein